MLIDNIELVKDHLLDFRSKDDFYIIKVIVRRKDVIDNPKYKGYHDLFGSHHERFINWYTVRTMNEFNIIADLVRCICRDNPFRAYISTDVKSHYKTINTLNDYIREYYKNEASPFDKLVKGNSLQYKKFEDLMKSSTSKSESTSNRDRSYILLDIDSKSTAINNKVTNLCDNLILDYKYKDVCLKDNTSKQLYIKYDTFNGQHLILPFIIFKKIIYQLKKPNSKIDNVASAYSKLMTHDDVDVKKCAMALLYANGDNFNL